MKSIPPRAWALWGVAVAAYTIAVMQRTSLGVAGLDAGVRFDVSASVLGTFAVVQLLVYAAMQIPVGVMVDRAGPRILVVTGAALMATGQLALALAETLPAAVAARVLVGAGDAMTFISVIRLIAAWFPPRRVPLLTQLTGIIGQTGQILSAVPLAAILHTAGWSAAFISAASLSVLASVLALAVLRDSPDGNRTNSGAPTWARVRADLVSAWLHPGTRLGLWTHFSTPFPGTVFVMLWGYPFLVSAQGLTRDQAGRLLTIMVIVGMIAAPILGEAVARHPLRRSWIVLTVTGSAIVAWSAVLLWPGRSPYWLLLLLVTVLALGGPASMIGFDYARTFNPPRRFGTATGVVNVGGFVAALVAILAIGIVLDLTGSGSSYSLPGFKIAMLVQYPLWLLGLIGILRTRHLVRKRLAREGTVVPRIRDVLARRRRRRRAASR